MKIKRPEPKPCIFIGSSRKDLKGFPAKVQNRVGYALNQVQEGDEPLAAKALRGFGLIKSRLRDAEMHYRARIEKGRHKP